MESWSDFAICNCRNPLPNRKLQIANRKSTPRPETAQIALTMTRLRLLLRNLAYFRGVNVAVVLGMAVATAVLTGALMVGDSVRGSLADLTLQRLGPVDYALISNRFFDQSLAARMSAGGKVPPLAGAILLRGGAGNE